MKKLILFTLFLHPITLLGTDEPEKQAPFYIIPLLNIPISFEQKDDKSDEFSIGDISAEHFILAHLQKNALDNKSITLQTMIEQHALLWIARHTLGFLNVLGHELGHAIAGKLLGYRSSSITITYSSKSWLSCMYAGYTFHETENDTDSALYKESKIIIDKESSFKWARKVQKRYAQEISRCLAGPIAGITTTSILAYTLSYIQSTLWSQDTDNIKLCIIAAMIPMLQNILSLLPYEDYDGAHVRDIWEKSRALEERMRQIHELPDDSPVTLNFDK
jgi:hypothetical protein